MEIRIAAAILALSAAPVLADVPPGVPATRASQIFSPFFFGFGDDGEGVYASGGPACLDYSMANNFEQANPPVHGIAATAGLSQFQKELQTTSGLDFVSSHGDVNP